MKKHDAPRSRISVEDLLRVKKSERPSREFWGDWQGQLKARVREAASVKRSWWKDVLPRFGITVARWHVAVGATALASLVIVALEEYQPALPSLPVAAATVSANEVLASEVPAVSTARVAAGTMAASRVGASVRLPSASLRNYAPGELSNAVAMILTPDRSVSEPHGGNTTLGSSMQASLGLQQPLATPSTGSTLRLDVQKVAVAMNEPASTRHSRYFHYSYTPSARLDSADALHGPDSTPGRLNEDELYETASSRIGARGDRISLRF